MTTFSEADEGKPVFDINDDRVGVVSAVEDGTAYVEFGSGIPDALESALGFGEPDTGPYPLQDEMIDRVYDDRIRLRGDHLSE